MQYGLCAPRRWLGPLLWWLVRALGRMYNVFRLTGDGLHCLALIVLFAKMNQTRSQLFENSQAQIPPMATRASVGHALNGIKAAQPPASASFKLKKFSKVGHQVDTRR